MPGITKVSVSVPCDLLLLAKHSHLQAPDEPLSNFFARLLGEALERRDTDSYADLPPTAQEDAVSDAILRASVAALSEDNPDLVAMQKPVTDAERRARRSTTRRRAAG
jgi:hypothetical protein